MGQTFVSMRHRAMTSSLHTVFRNENEFLSLVGIVEPFRQPSVRGYPFARTLFRIKSAE
jgi:hypothetical protein